MGDLPAEGEYEPALHHAKIINEIVDPSFASTSLIRSYQRSFNGFAANLTTKEKDRLAGYHGVVSVYPSEEHKPQTTRSWSFMRMSRTIQRLQTSESNIIIGIIDSGIWPESESFSDQGLGPIPDKWKGVCQGGSNFVCNRKIIGARVYTLDFFETNISARDFTARDFTGHGTHVGSTAAGNYVGDVSYYGIAEGVARGGVPSARIGVYKVCAEQCYGADILAAFDDAVADGVDIISISLNSDKRSEVTSDSIALGSFHALMKGVLTVHAAGNDGPHVSTIASYAPWILTVGASNIDRRIIDKLVLGSNQVVVGHGINAFPSSDGKVPLVYGAEVTSTCTETDARKCTINCLNSRLVAQKVILCDEYPNFNMAKVSGALGFIIPDYEERNVSRIMPYPFIALRKDDLDLVRAYKNSTVEPTAQILQSEVIEDPTTPLVANFSSRGPSIFLDDLIKPDVVAPGVEIIAAYSPLASPSDDPSMDMRHLNYNIMSGTSMACPHVAGAAAFVKSFHPDWSPSVIKSALMTTALDLNPALNPESEFAYGSGHINPLRALNPGLVYEEFVTHYLRIWCNLTDPIPTNISCLKTLTPRELNYPSMVARLYKKDRFKVVFQRTLKNVGPANSTYKSYIYGDRSKMRIGLVPRTLEFKEVGQQIDYTITLRGKQIKPWSMLRLSLMWSDGVHFVRSPFVLYAKDLTNSGGKRRVAPSWFRIFVIFVVIVVL